MPGLLRLLSLSILIFILSSCASVPRFTSNKETVPVEEKPDQAPVQYENTVEVLESTIGLASYYSEPFHGQETSNGETYNKYGLTAAHSSYPYNTIIRVTNLNNNKSVNVRINDRMPKHPARIIDLSYGTALQLDMLNDGVVKVKLDILKWGE